MGKGFILWRGFAGGEDRAAGDPRFAGIRGEARAGGSAAAPAARTGTLCPWRRRGVVKPTARTG